MTLDDAYAKLKINKKNRNVVLTELRQLNLEKITAGIHASDGKEVISGSGFKLIDVAVQNEFGNSWTLDKTIRFFKKGKWWIIKKGKTINIPTTRFVSRIIEDINERKNLINEFKVSLYLLLKYGESGNKKDLREFITDIGSYMRDRIRAGIDEKMFEPNAPLTIAIKGFDKRLFEEGTLYNAIKFRSRKAKVEG